MLSFTKYQKVITDFSRRPTRIKETIRVKLLTITNAILILFPSFILLVVPRVDQNITAYINSLVLNNFVNITWNIPEGITVPLLKITFSDVMLEWGSS